MAVAFSAAGTTQAYLHLGQCGRSTLLVLARCPEKSQNMHRSKPQPDTKVPSSFATARKAMASRTGANLQGRQITRRLHQKLLHAYELPRQSTGQGLVRWKGGQNFTHSMHGCAVLGHCRNQHTQRHGTL